MFLLVLLPPLASLLRRRRLSSSVLVRALRLWLRLLYRWALPAGHARFLAPRGSSGSNGGGSVGSPRPPPSSFFFFFFAAAARAGRFRGSGRLGDRSGDRRPPDGGTPFRREGGGGSCRSWRSRCSPFGAACRDRDGAAAAAAAPLCRGEVLLRALPAQAGGGEAQLPRALLTRVVQVNEREWGRERKREKETKETSPKKVIIVVV